MNAPDESPLHKDKLHKKVNEALPSYLDRRDVEAIVKLIQAHENALLDRILEKLPEKKTLETDLPLDAYEDEERFCVECGQYEFEGQLNCRCCGFNEALDTIKGILEGERHGG